MEEGRRIAPGLMTYVGVESATGRKTLLGWARHYNAVSIFHPLRVIAGGCMVKRKVELAASDEEELAANLIHGPCRRRLERDLERLTTSSFQSTLKSLLSNAETVKLVLHTEYELPLWCSHTFRKTLLEAARKALESIPRDYRVDEDLHVTVEVHPGIAALTNCKLLLYPNNKYYLTCEDVGRPEDALPCLEQAIKDLKSLSTLTSNFSIALEPRSASLPTVKGSRPSQAIATHADAAAEAKKLGVNIVVDPSQHPRGITAGYEDAENVIETRPELIEEIHIHNKHKPLNKADTTAYTKLIIRLTQIPGPLTSIIPEITKPAENTKNKDIRRLNIQTLNIILTHTTQKHT